MGLERRNNALRLNGNTVNGATADIAITTRGSDLYFAVCAIMAFSAITIIGLSMRKPRRDRLFHYLCAAITFVAAIAYFTMGSNLGFTPIQVEFFRSNPKVAGTYREIFYVRYIDWFITTPLLLMDLLLTAGMPWPTILWVILVDWIMIVTGLVGALVVSRYKWGYFAFGCAALFYIVYQLAFEARRHSKPLGQDVNRVFFMCGTLTLFLWILYPIAWGLCEGGNVIAPDSEAIFYSILDVLAKPVFSALLIYGHRNIDPARLGLAIKDYDDDASVGLREKHNATGGVATGPVDGPLNGERHGQTNAHTNGISAATHGATDAV